MRYYAQQSCTAGRAAFIGGNDCAHACRNVASPGDAADLRPALRNADAGPRPAMWQYPPSQSPGSLNLGAIEAHAAGLPFDVYFPGCSLETVEIFNGLLALL